MTGPRRPDPREPDTVPIPTRVIRRRSGADARPSPPAQRTQPAPPWYAPPRPLIPPAAEPAGPATPPTSGPDLRRLLIGTSVVALTASAVLLALVLTKLGIFGTAGATELDVGRAQEGVRRILTDPIDGYGRENVTDVRCNDGRNPVVKAGSGFTCRVTVDGAERQVAVLFADDTGTYEVDRPR